MTLFFGKYRGKVEDNADPYLCGRIQVTAPAALGDVVAWAMPCAPFAGPGVGFFAVPPVGANVWVEFEGGNPQAPIWSGCFWNRGDFPAAMAVPQMKVLKTDTATVTLSDLPGPAGGVTIETADGNKITLSATSIEINNGKGATVTLQGPKVSINGSALEVT
jgi:uncharacterized protein involved in type VI secretion and phage assembly